MNLFLLLVIRIHQYGKLRMIPNKLAKQFIPLNLTYSFLPLTNKYSLSLWTMIFALFLDRYGEKAGKVELCVSNGSQNNGQNKLKFLNGKSNKNSANLQTFVHKKFFFHGCLSVTGFKKALRLKNCFAFKIEEGIHGAVNADSPNKI